MRHQLQQWRLPIIWLILATALLARALVPSGFMPAQDAERGIVVELCNSDARWTIPMKPRAPAEHGKKPAPCAFSALAVAGDLPASGLTVSAPMPVAQAAVVEIARLMLARLRHERPWSQGPPFRS